MYAIVDHRGVWESGYLTYLEAALAIAKFYPGEDVWVEYVNGGCLNAECRTAA